MKKLLWVGLFACLILSGCAHSMLMGQAKHTVGREFSNKAVNQLQQGITTMNQVEQLFGQPHAIRVKPGTITWVYSYIPTTVDVNLVKGRWCRPNVDVDTNTRIKILKITFEEGLVTEYFYTTYIDEEVTEDLVSMLDEDLALLLSEEKL